MMKQRSIKKSVSIEGVGLHTGKKVKMTFLPAPPNHGYKFKRIDLEDEPIIPADISRVISTNRGTTIRAGEAQVSTIEHTLSALRGMDVDNVLIEIDGPETPILDGSAGLIVKMILEAGMEEQDAEREYFEIEEPISYRDEVTGTELMALPADDFQVTTLIDFGSPVLGQQYAKMENIDTYAEQIAPCRTFVFLHEVEALLNQGLIKGGDLENAVVIADRVMDKDELERLAKKLDKPGVAVDKEGVLNTSELRFKNEPARHKLLDVIGDMALLGVSIKGKIMATKPGHTSNVEFTKILKKAFQEQRKLRGKPKYDPTIEPIFDTNRVMEWLPHRYPMLLVDKIIELSDRHVVGIKNVTMNEAFFQGHFPGNPVFPGVLQVEALAQTGGILAMSLQEDPNGWDTYFLKIDQTKFKQKVVPGDTLILKMELMGPIRRGIVQMYGTAYVGNKIVSEGELTAQIVRRS
ncbi:MAG: bifunctional UDP-3-O-[3-hydroxymyristoyl] N-acetylglucosamine deacetylase/3-hydroxyacyl-ACP dehydratase [Saprospiraceae bacterium]|nr:bifunctional UDP-3-O-[3-hydroxymyristoyl] N-acetylglucosamine deacetylase/3-hydroxyacyl-ACP dehydratase [Saprospiraceae bacterium]